MWRQMYGYTDSQRDIWTDGMELQQHRLRLCTISDGQNRPPVKYNHAVRYYYTYGKLFFYARNVTITSKVSGSDPRSCWSSARPNGTSAVAASISSLLCSFFAMKLNLSTTTPLSHTTRTSNTDRDFLVTNWISECNRQEVPVDLKTRLSHWLLIRWISQAKNCKSHVTQRICW